MRSWQVVPKTPCFTGAQKETWTREVSSVEGCYVNNALTHIVVLSTGDIARHDPEEHRKDQEATKQQL